MLGLVVRVRVRLSVRARVRIRDMGMVRVRIRVRFRVRVRVTVRVRLGLGLPFKCCRPGISFCPYERDEVGIGSIHDEKQGGRWMERGSKHYEKKSVFS